jgi:hypothetical protein
MSAGHVDVIWCLVLVRTGVTPNKDLWIDTCVLRIPTGNQRVNQTQKGRLRMILRLRSHAEPVEVGVLRHVVSELTTTIFYKWDRT